MKNNLVKIGDYGSRIEAEMVQSLLHSNGIESVIRADDCGGFYASQAFSIGIQVFVDESDFHLANSIIDNPVAFSDEGDISDENDNDNDSLEQINDIVN